MLHWLYDGYREIYGQGMGASVENWKRYGSLLGLSLNSSDLVINAIARNRTVVYGSRIRYAAVVVNTTMSPFLGYQKGLPILHKWESMFSRAKARMTGSLKSGVMLTPDKNDIGGGIYHWFKVQETLTSSALAGVAISLGLALPVLIFSTDDIIIGFFGLPSASHSQQMDRGKGFLGGLATLIICATSLSVIGLIPLAGWKLGVLESLNLTLVVGLAIDYIVHVAEAYHLSDKPTRKEKVDEILEHIGVSVISGAVSTLGASLFMLFAQIAFFMQFGLFIFCTVGFSLLYSLGMFIVLLSLIGPEDQRFSVSANLSKFLPQRTRKRGEEGGLVATTEASGSLLDLGAKSTVSIDDDNVSTDGESSPQSQYSSQLSFPSLLDLGAKSTVSIDDDNVSTDGESLPQSQYSSQLSFPSLLDLGAKSTVSIDDDNVSTDGESLPQSQYSSQLSFSSLLDLGAKSTVSIDDDNVSTDGESSPQSQLKVETATTDLSDSSDGQRSGFLPAISKVHPAPLNSVEIGRRRRPKSRASNTTPSTQPMI